MQGCWGRCLGEGWRLMCHREVMGAQQGRAFRSVPAAWKESAGPPRLYLAWEGSHQSFTYRIV